MPSTQDLLKDPHSNLTAAMLFWLFHKGFEDRANHSMMCQSEDDTELGGTWQ